MALIKCPECNHEISDTVKNCPHCGYNINGINEKNISHKIPLAISIVYVICVCIYAMDFIWKLSNIIMLIVGIGLVAIIALGEKICKRNLEYLFLIIYLIGSFVTIFDYNISRIDLNLGFFSPYIYNDSLGVILAIFQVISVTAIILLCISIFMPQISRKYAAVMLFISGIIGLVFHIYDKIYLSDKWGTGKYSTFYIWLGIVTLCFFLVGFTYILATNKKNK